MIAKLTGIVDSIEGDQVIIDVRGVGYALMVSRQSQMDLPAVGSEVTLHVITRTSDDKISLYGFINIVEKQWFWMLIAVPGIGNKAAMAILSQLSARNLVDAIVDGDAKAISQADGVGAKLAKRLIVELAPKVKNLTSAQAGKDDGSDLAGVRNILTQSAESIWADVDQANLQVISDTLSAMTNLGLARNVAQTCVKKAFDALKVEELFQNSDQQKRTEILIRAALSVS